MKLKIENFRKDNEDHHRQTLNFLNKRKRTLSTQSNPDTKKVGKKKKNSLSLEDLLKSKSRGEIVDKVKQKFGHISKGLNEF